MPHRHRLPHLLLVATLLLSALVAPLAVPQPARAVDTLTPGDIAIVGYNADDPDEFAFVLLANVSAGTSITFTDNGWLAGGGFRANEGTATWTAPDDLCAGQVITPDPGTMLFSTSGDQVLAYQGSESSPTFIYALNNEGAGVWQSDATSSNTSALPTGLTNGTTAVALQEVDNAVYAGIATGTRAELLAAISNNTNWSGSNDTRQTMPAGPFTVTDAPPCGPENPLINEFVFNHTGTDSYEFVEVLGSTSTDYSSYWLLQVEGDEGSNRGQVDGVQQVGTSDASGYWITGYLNSVFENGTVTLLLVEGFSGMVGDDLDSNDDGTLDATPWTGLVDAVAINDGGAGDLTYGTPVLSSGFDGIALTPGGASRIPNGIDTDAASDWTRNDFDGAGIPALDPGTPAYGEAYNTPGTANAPVPPSTACGDPADLIHAVQGSGASSPVTGQTKTVEGLVVGDFQGMVQLSGFFVQEEPGDFDSDPLTSEGIFVYEGSATSLDVAVGDVVRVTGVVAEYDDRTLGGGTMTELTSPSMELCSSGSPVAAISVSLPEASDGDLERFEGMLVQVTGAMTVAQNYFVGRYGQMTLSASGRLYQPTNQHVPGSVEAANLADANARSILILDDGVDVSRCGDNPNPVPYLGGPPPAVLRAGDQVGNLVGVLDYGQINSGSTGPCNDGATLFAGDFRLHPTQSPLFTTGNPRPGLAPAVGGNVQVASMNVLNFFNGDGNKGGFPTSRGASTFEEFVRQRIKLYKALAELDADVVGLMELENDGFGATSAIAELVKVLNEGPCWNSATECANLGYASSGLGPGTYAVVDPGTGAIGNDEITVGLIYKPATVTPVGGAAVLDDAAFTDPRSTGSQRNRPALAQTFQENAWGEVLTVVVNHLKSKGSACGVGDDDTITGQGNCNGTRTDGASYLVNTWLPGDPTGSMDPDFLLIGDLNAYAQEDPIAAITGAGYTNLVNVFVGSEAYSYIFDGQSGYLDHGLASADLVEQVAGTAEWHINTDEPAVIDYDQDFNPAGYYYPDVYRASDHDPLLMGLNLCPDAATPTDLTIAVNAVVDGVDLTWQAGATSTSFQVWRDALPYFTPDPVNDTPLATPIVASYTDENVLGNPAANLYYVVTGVNDCGEASAISNRVGKFEFTLVPGEP